MSAIMPCGELVRRAASWICAELAARPHVSQTKLLDEAGMRFNLSPKECRMLSDLFAASAAPPAQDDVRRPD